MKHLVFRCILALACINHAAAEGPGSSQDPVIADCAREAAANGYTGREFDDFVASCAKANRSKIEIDPAILAAMSSC